MHPGRLAGSFYVFGVEGFGLRVEGLGGLLRGLRAYTLLRASMFGVSPKDGPQRAFGDNNGIIGGLL